MSTQIIELDNPLTTCQQEKILSKIVESHSQSEKIGKNDLTKTLEVPDKTSRSA